MSVNDIWRLRVQGVVSGTQHQHTLHFRENEPLLQGDALVTAYSGAPLTAFRACFAIGQPVAQLLRFEKVCGSVPLPGPIETAPAGANNQGTRPTFSSENLPAFIAACVNEKGSLAGRRYSGRFFLGGLMETDTNQNDLVGNYVNVVNAYIDALRAAFITGTPAWRLFCFSELLAKGRAANTPGQPPSQVTAVQCGQAGSDTANLILNMRPTTMRSRKLGHGL